MSEEAEDKEVIGLYKKKFPLVLVNRYIKDKNIPSILIGNEKGAYIATRALIDSGHEKIVFMNASLKFQLDRDKLKGYKKALLENNIKFDEDLVRAGFFDFDRTSSALSSLLEQKNPLALYWLQMM